MFYQKGIASFPVSMASRAYFAILDAIADICWDLGRKDLALSNYQLIIQKYPQSEYVQNAQFNLKSNNIMTVISSANEPNVQNEIDALIAGSNDINNLSKRLFEIGQAYEKVSKPNEACNIYSQIVQIEPNSSTCRTAEFHMRKLHIMRSIADGNDANVPGEIDKFMADFNDDGLSLAYFVFDMAAAYYERAQERPSDRPFAQENFTKAAAIWDKIITNLSDLNDVIIGRAYHFSGYCHSKIWDYPTTLLYYHYVLNRWPNYEYVWNVQCLMGDCYEGLVRTGVLTQLEAEPEMEYAYKTTLEKYPGCGLEAHAAFKLGWLYYNWGLNMQAGVYFGKYIEATNPEDPRIATVQQKLAEIAGNQ